MIQNRLTRHLLVLLAIVAVCLLLAACGGDDDSSTPTPTPNGSINAGAEQQLRDLAGKWRDANTKVSYTVASAFGAARTEAQLVIYRKPPSDVRLDYTGGGKTTIAIIRSDLGYSCSDLGESCVLLSVEEAKASAELLPFVNSLADSTSLDAIIGGAETLETAPAETVAGQETTCVTAEGDDLGGIPGKATWCFTDEGLLLKMDYEGAGTTLELTASKIEDSVDTDFDPIYAVTTIPPTATPAASP